MYQTLIESWHNFLEFMDYENSKLLEKVVLKRTADNKFLFYFQQIKIISNFQVIISNGQAYCCSKKIEVIVEREE